MHPRFESKILFIVFLVVFGSSLSAATEKVSIPFQVKNHTQGSLRYQLNSEAPTAWTLLSNDNLQIVFYTDDKTEDTVYLQQQNNHGAWSLSTKLQWDGISNSWIMVQDKQSEDIRIAENASLSYKVKNSEQRNQASDESSSKNSTVHKNTEHHLSILGGASLSIPLTEVKDTYYSSGYGADISLAWHTDKHVITSDLFYQMGLPKNIAVDSIHEGGLSLSYGYAINLGTIKIQPELGGGLIMHTSYRGNKLLGFYFDGIVLGGLKVFFGITNNIDLFLKGQVMTYEWNESKLMHSAIASAGISSRL